MSTANRKGTMKKRLYDEYLRRLLEVNDESKTDDEHRQIEARFRGWLEGVEDAAGYRFNGDYYYIELFNTGKMKERPLCCGVFLDWKSNAPRERPAVAGTLDGVVGNSGGDE